MPNKTRELFDGISRFVQDSHDLLKRGAIMELKGLDDQVAALCKEVLLLSQDERVRYADDLQRLLGELNGLGEALTLHRDTMANEILNLSQHRKASVAYRTTDHTDQDAKKEPE